MLSLSTIRSNPSLIKEKLAIKNFEHPQIIDAIIKKDEAKRVAQTTRDEQAKQLNTTSKQIGILISQSKQDEASALKSGLNTTKTKIQELDSTINALATEIHNLLIELPNLPTSEVPTGTSEKDNVIVESIDINDLPAKPFKELPHWELVKKYDLIDFELGSKVTGSGFPFYKKMGALLQRKTINYFLDYNIAAGYTEYQTPLLVNENAAFATGQLPDKEGQMYHIPNDKLFLIPTAEVPLTNLYQDTIVSVDDLPIKLTGHTACFRREAGSYGKDVKGLNRLHQFDKVEIVQIVTPEMSDSALLEMVNHIKQLIISLGLPYRILKLCGGDTGFASAITYDFEIYSVAQKRWLEVSSVSNFLSFQSNRLNLRYKNKDKKNIHLHTLNGSSLALPRIIASLLEFYQTANGIQTPKVLIPYLKQDYIV